MDNIDRERYSFDFRRRLADAVERLTRKELVAFYRQRLLLQPRELLVWSAGTRFPGPRENHPKTKVGTAGKSG
jgi:secreted Zn-dependent insulinase-like peptidase